MGDILSIVSKPTFRHYDRLWGTQEGRSLAPGDTLRWHDYERPHPHAHLYLERGDRIFLVTVRPGPRLWLLAVYEDVARRGDSWYAARPNRVRITDITALRPKLDFNTGNGLRGPDEKLGNALQVPRLLTDRDAALLEKAIARQRVTLTLPRRPTDADEAREGERLSYEVTRYTRSLALARKCLARDGHRCRHCGFAVAPTLAKKLREHGALARVMHVHHVDPLHDQPERTTSLADLLTLCPTCHAMVHAIARALGKTSSLSLPLLRKYHPMPHSVRRSPRPTEARRALTS